MAGKFTCNAAGQRIWVEDGAGGEGHAASGDPRDPQGLGSESSPKKPAHPLSEIANYEANKQEAKRLAGIAAGWRPTATAGVASAPTFDRTNETAVRAQQKANMDRLARAAWGTGGPTLTTGASRAAIDSTLKAQMGAPRGGFRNALGAGAQAYGANAINMGAMAADEQQSAWNTLGGAAHGMRSADLAGATDEAKLLQQIALANAGNAQAVSLANQNAEQQGMINAGAAARGYGGLIQDAFSADQEYRAFLEGRERRARAVRDRDNALEQQQAASTIGTVGTIAAGAMVASDRREKSHVKPAEGDLRAMLDTIHGYSYNYKDPDAPGAGPGRHVGVMAQDLEKHPLTSGAVVDTPNGKMVRYDQLGPVNLAATAYLNDRLDSIEKRYAAAFGAKK